MSTGANLGYTDRIDSSLDDATAHFTVANLTADGAPAVAEQADRVHVAGGKLLVIVDDVDAASAISAAQSAGAEADVWAVAHVDDTTRADAIVTTARGGGRANVGCVRYGDDPGPTDGVAGWLGVVRP
jgi:hypothetical protein